MAGGLYLLIWMNEYGGEVGVNGATIISSRCFLEM